MIGSGSESSRSVAGRAAPKTPAVSKRVLSNAALPSRRSDMHPGLIPMVTPAPAPTAEVPSQRHAVGSPRLHRMDARSNYGADAEAKLVRRHTTHDTKHWSYLVWRVTHDCPLAKLAADTSAKQGPDRKELASMDAPGATTHVCMWPDPITKKPCGHSWHFKPKATRNSQVCDVFSPSCKSIQSSYVTHHILVYSKHGVPTDAKVLSVRRQETHFAHAASTPVRLGVRALLSDAPNPKALKHVQQRYAFFYAFLVESIFIKICSLSQSHSLGP
jgi:hypothetical protein